MNPFSGSALVLRQRGVWEAADSGILLWKNSFVYFIPFFALPVWICACSLRLLSQGAWYIPYLALWWLKPFFGRLVLHTVSVRFFGGADTSSLKGLCRGLFKNLAKGLPGDLLWRRFSPYRSARMPIRMLERAGPEQYRLRKNTLVPGGLNFGSFISVFCLALEAVLLSGEIAFTAAAAHMFSPSALGYIRGNIETVEVLIFAAYCFNYVLVESLYVCMGFGLYINSRVEVEGWDLQILFQEFAEAAGKRGTSGRGITALLLVWALLSAPQGVYAASGEGAPPQEEASLLTGYVFTAGENGPREGYFPGGFPGAGAESMEDLETILASPDFGGEREGWAIRFRKPWDLSGIEMTGADFPPWVKTARRVFSLALRFFAVLAAAGFAGFAGYWLWKYRKKAGRPFRSGGRNYASPLVSPEEPEPLFARSEIFFRQGKLREAWASCFAGSLAAYGKYCSLSFPPDATEYGCLERVRLALPVQAKGFAGLVQDWVLLAYAGKLPAAGAFEEALAYGRSLLGLRPEPVSGTAGAAEKKPAGPDNETLVAHNGRNRPSGGLS